MQFVLAEKKILMIHSASAAKLFTRADVEKKVLLRRVNERSTKYFGHPWDRQLELMIAFLMFAGSIFTDFHCSNNQVEWRLIVFFWAFYDFQETSFFYRCLLWCFKLP